MDQAKKFEFDLVARLDEAECITGYSFKGIRDLIAAKGGVGAALQLLQLSSLGVQPEGFKVLVRFNLLGNSLEQTVLDWKDSGLFPAGIIASARARLVLARAKIAREAAAAANRAPS